MYTFRSRIMSTLLVVLLTSIACPSRALAGDKPEKEAQFAQKVKSEIARLGTGPDARVEVKLRDKTKLKGYISELGNESFAVVEDRAGSATTVTYPQVKQVKGNNLSTGAKILIGVGIGFGIVLLLALLAPHIAQ
jgi:hypothetical protein